MNKASLKKIRKSNEFIKLLLNQKKRKPVPTPRQHPSLFDEVPEINVPILKPTVVTTTLNKLPNVIQKTTENVINWEEWLKNADKVIEEQILNGESGWKKILNGESGWKILINWLNQLSHKKKKL